MIRSIAIVTITASLVLWTGQVFSQEVPAEVSAEVPAEVPEAVDASCTPACYQQPCLHGRYGHSCPVHGRACPLRGRSIGSPQMTMPLPVRDRQATAPQPAPGYFGGLFTPRQYRPGVPPMGQPMMGQPMGQYQPGVPPMGQVPNYRGSVPEQRIVYVPYTMPPPIQVERLGKALPRPPVPIVRRLLGDAYMYEYPEMPLRLYTTRGPRDFFAPNPPSIGE